MKKMRALKNSKGFTLIELLIVIAVIAILIALISPAVINAIDKANENTGKAIEKTFDNAIQRFYAEKNRYPTGINELIPDYITQSDYERATEKFNLNWVAGNPPKVQATPKQD